MTFYCSYYFAPSYMCHHLPTTTILNNPGGTGLSVCALGDRGGGPSCRGHWGVRGFVVCIVCCLRDISSVRLIPYIESRVGSNTKYVKIFKLPKKWKIKHQTHRISITAYIGTKNELKRSKFTLQRKIKKLLLCCGP